VDSWWCVFFFVLWAPCFSPHSGGGGVLSLGVVFFDVFFFFFFRVFGFVFLGVFLSFLCGFFFFFFWCGIVFFFRVLLWGAGFFCLVLRFVFHLGGRWGVLWAPRLVLLLWGLVLWGEGGFGGVVSILC